MYSLQSHFYPFSTWQVLILYPILDTLTRPHKLLLSQQDPKLGMATGKLALQPDRKLNLIKTQTTNLHLQTSDWLILYIGRIYICRHTSKMFHRNAVWTAYLNPTEVQMVFMEFDATRRKSQDVNESPGILNWNSAQTVEGLGNLRQKKTLQHKPPWSRLSLRLNSVTVSPSLFLSESISFSLFS